MLSAKSSCTTDPAAMFLSAWALTSDFLEGLLLVTPLPKSHEMGAAYQARNDAALARLKANADRRAEELRPVLSDLRAAGITGLIQTAAELNRRQIATSRHGKWHPMTVARLVARLRSAEPRDDEELTKLVA